MLRGHRRAARLTLEQLAEVSGVSARTLSDMERGRSQGPQHRTVTALADALAWKERRAKATVTETPGSHAVFVSRPAVVAAVISQAAQS